MSIDTHTVTHTAETKAVKTVLDDLYRAWAAGDADAFVADYLEDATSILSGTFRQSREEVRQAMAAGFAGPLKGSRAVDEVQSVRFLTDDTAVVVSRGGIVLAGTEGVAENGWIVATWTLVRRDGRWLIAAYHNCPA